MKKYFFSLLVFTMFLAMTCRKNSCHYEIQFKNNSSDTVIFAVPVSGIYGSRLDGDIVAPSHTHDFLPTHGCIERNSSDSSRFTMYIVDKKHFNEENFYYHEDSIEYYNTILKKYDMSIEELTEVDFIINYP